MRTPFAAYAATPHKTIAELVAHAARRAGNGEHPSEIIQDLVDGYCLGWQSANHRLIELAATGKRQCLLCGAAFEPSQWNRTACKQCLDSCKEKDGRP